MSIRIGRVRIKLHFLFFGLLSYMMSTQMCSDYLTALLFAALHESAHIAAMIMCGCRIVDVTVGIFGMRIDRSDDVCISFGKEIFIASAGPLTNLLCAGILFCTNLYFNSGFIRRSVYLNLGLFVMNMLPMISLDGGRMIYFALCRLSGEHTARVTLGVCGGLTVTALLIMIVIAGNNITMYIAGVYVVILYISSFAMRNYP